MKDWEKELKEVSEGEYADHPGYQKWLIDFIRKERESEYQRGLKDGKSCPYQIHMEQLLRWKDSTRFWTT